MRRVDAVAVFILVRGSAKTGTAVRDIGDTVAHDARDRGVVHAKLNEVVDQMLTAMRRGRGNFTVVPAYTMSEILDELARIFASESLGFDRARAREHRPDLARQIASVMAGTEIDLRDPELKARIEMMNNGAGTVLLD